MPELAEKITPAILKLEKQSFPRYQFKDLDSKAGDFISFIMYSLRLSVAYGIHGKYDGKRKKCYFNPQDCRFYYATTIPKLTDKLNQFFKISERTVKRIIKKLNGTKYLKENRKEWHIQLEVPLLDSKINQWIKDHHHEAIIPMASAKCQNGTLPSDKMALKCKNQQLRTNNSLHTNTPLKNKIFSWKSATAHKFRVKGKELEPIIKFMETYKKPNDIINGLEQYYWKVIQARNFTKVHYDIDKSVVLFEHNSRFQQELPMALQNQFGQITANTNYNKAHPNRKPMSPNKDHYIGWIVDQLKMDFMDWLDAKPKKTTKTDRKDTDDQTVVHTKHGVIKQKLPKWARSDYKVKLHPASKKTIAKVEKQIKDMNKQSKARKAKQAKEEQAALDPEPEKQAKDDNTLADGTPLVNPFAEPKDNESDKQAKDDDLYTFTTDEGMDHADLRDDLVKSNEDKMEINKHDESGSTSDSIFENNPKLVRFNGGSINTLKREIEQLDMDINRYKNKMPANIVNRITKDAESIVKDDMKEPETVPPTNKPKEPAYLPF